MKKIMFVLAVLLFSTTQIFAQFQARYDSVGSQNPWSLDFVPGGFVIAGGSRVNSQWSPFIMHVDHQGEILWHNTYLTIPPSNSYRYIFADVAMPNWIDNHFYVVGNGPGYPDVGLGGWDMLLSQVDIATGDLTKTIRIGTTLNDIASNVVTTKKLKIMVAGHTQEWLTGGGFDRDISLAMIDVNGNIDVGYRYRKALLQETTGLYASREEGYLLTGRIELEKPCHDDKTAIFVLRVDNKLNVKWFKAIDIISDTGEPSEDLAASITEDDRGNIVVTGSIHVESEYYLRPFLIKLDYDGNVKWVKKYDIKNVSPIAQGRSVLSLTTSPRDSEYVVAGQVTAGPYHAIMFKTNSNGEVKWGMRYISQYASRADKVRVGKGLKGQTLFAFTGRVHEPDFSLENNTAMVLTDENGKSATKCDEITEIKDEKQQFCTLSLGIELTEPLSIMEVFPKPNPITSKKRGCHLDSASSDTQFDESRCARVK